MEVQAAEDIIQHPKDAETQRKILVSDGTDEELNKCELYFPQVLLQQEAAILYFILKLLVIRRAACRLYLQISLINVPTYTSHCFVYLYLKELFDCKPRKSSLFNIKETMYWPRYLIYSISIRKGRRELQDPKTGLWECFYSVSLLRYSLQEVLFSDFSFTV